LEFLKNNESENLFLVGDIIDGWELKRKFYWDKNHNLIIQKILKKSRKGTKVYYIPGNHDSFMRDFIGEILGDIEIKNEVEYITIKGDKCLILHGDQFDGIISYFKWLQKLGSFLYDQVLTLNLLLNNIRNRFGLSHWSLSKFLKDNTKEAIKYTSNYRNCVIDYANKHNANIIISGHIHKAEISYFDNIKYINTGDFIESMSVVVEKYDGKFELIYCK
jgi:UDP-2,3-diacylglucosamine pyrophosphatase LpxH